MLQDAHTANFRVFKLRPVFVRKAIYDGCSGEFLTWMYGARKPQNENNVMFAVDANNRAALRWFTKRMPNISDKPYWLAVEREFWPLRDHLRDRTKKIGQQLVGFDYSDEDDKWTCILKGIPFDFERDIEPRDIRIYDTDNDNFVKLGLAHALDTAAIYDPFGNLRGL